jgi:hypothetical protein
MKQERTRLEVLAHPGAVTDVDLAPVLNLMDSRNKVVHPSLTGAPWV